MAAKAFYPLAGVKVLELAGLAPVPFAGMVLADFGSQVTRISRPGDRAALDNLGRGKKCISINLKCDAGKAVLKRLSATADVLIEPYRPGVMEKLGIGPQVLCKENEKMIYARLNGYGDRGVLSTAAGHDINYLAISGILSRLGAKGEPPCPPINLLGDFAGGSLVAVLGIMMALFERGISGKGQVVEASITEGTAYVSSFLHRTRNTALWFGDKGESLLDGGAPFYQTYETKDGKYMAVGALESQFYSQFIKGLGCECDDSLKYQMDVSQWPHMKKEIAEKFKSRTQAEWNSIFEGTDACVTPVLDMEEAALHSHNIDNNTFMKNSDGDYEPCPAPKLSRTPGVCEVRCSPKTAEHTFEFLQEEGFSIEEIQSLLTTNSIEQYIPEASL